MRAFLLFNLKFMLEIKFLDISKVSKNLHLLRFLRPNEFTFKPGQFINVVIGPRMFRSYSIASHPESEFIDLLIKFPKGSKAKEYFFKLKQNDPVKIHGPFGQYIYRNSKFNKIHIVTGAGIAPNLSMLEEWIRDGAKEKTIMFYGVRFVENVPFFSKFKQWENTFNFKLYICVSRGKADNNISFKGRVLDVINNIYLKNNDISDFRDSDFYICGQPEMVKEVKEFLVNLGVYQSNIFYEKFDKAVL